MEWLDFKEIPRPQLNFFLSDAESALMKVVEQQLDCASEQCYFHTVKNWLEKIKALHLMTEFLNHGSVWFTFRLLQTLIFLPHVRVKEMFFACKTFFEKAAFLTLTEVVKTRMRRFFCISRRHVSSIKVDRNCTP